MKNYSVKEKRKTIQNYLDTVVRYKCIFFFLNLHQLEICRRKKMLQLLQIYTNLKCTAGKKYSTG